MSWKMLVNLILISIVILLNPLLCLTESNLQCHLSSCGNIENITYPFRLKGDPENCGDPNYELSCERNQTILNLYNGKYIVESINYNNSTIRVTDSGLNKENCSSTPLYTLTNENFTTEEPYRLLDNNNLETIAFINCAASINSPLYIDTSSCIKGLINSSNYAVLGELKLSKLEDSCSILVMVMMMTSNLNNKFSYVNIHQQLVYGLELSWHEIFCKECQGRGYCKLNINNEVIGCSRTRPCRDDYASSFKCK
jgi:hypothetical protein